jgi:Xaa-Pro aminopeptidase
MQQLEAIKAAQRLAYAAVTHVRSQLKVGMSEIEVAKLIEDYFSERGHKLYFHKPFAWFGDRTGFIGFKRPFHATLDSLIPSTGIDFLPTQRKLINGMAVTLDVAPAIEGLAVDIGYSFSFGENSQINQARRDLLKFRELILKLACDKKPICEIYRQTDLLLKELGYRNCHGLYPLGVLGHRIGALPMRDLPKISIMGFHPQAYAYLIKEKLKGPAIMTADEKRPLSEGLWAIEPHLGLADAGVKFEEIMVVTKDDAYWLDNDLPHITEVTNA